MKKTFEHLLGLCARDALAILKSAGIFDVRVTFTHAPARPQPPANQALTEAGETTLLRKTFSQFQVSDADGDPPPDPLLEPVPDEELLAQARVIGVRDDGRQLLVSRFQLTPKSSEAAEP